MNDGVKNYGRPFSLISAWAINTESKGETRFFLAQVHLFSYAIKFYAVKWWIGDAYLKFVRESWNSFVRALCCTGIYNLPHLLPAAILFDWLSVGIATQGAAVYFFPRFFFFFFFGWIISSNFVFSIFNVVRAGTAVGNHSNAQYRKSFTMDRKWGGRTAGWQSDLLFTFDNECRFLTLDLERRSNLIPILIELALRSGTDEHW